MSNEPFKLGTLTNISVADVKALERAHDSYGNSWKKRGGVGAFMMLARKWDRLENVLRPGPNGDEAMGSREGARFAPWDIFGAVLADQRPEGIIDDIRDLRRYLLLVESEIGELCSEGIHHLDPSPDPAEEPSAAYVEQ